MIGVPTGSRAAAVTDAGGCIRCWEYSWDFWESELRREGGRESGVLGRFSDEGLYEVDKGLRNVIHEGSRVY